MLDMGGAPSGSTSKNQTRVQNTSKNSKVQAVAFDFELLVKAIHDQGGKAEQPQDSTASSSRLPSASGVKPDVGQIQQMASLLKVDLDGSGHSEERRRQGRSYEEDDLSAILENSEEEKEEEEAASKPSASSNPLEDIRSKYAAKLHKKGVEGGIAGVELVNHQREEALKRGDAGGHWEARKLAVASSSQGQQGSKWMALTGTGKLLSTLTHRSVKIALLPRPPPARQQQPPQQQSPNERMLDLTRQLKDVVFDVLIDLPGAPDDKNPTIEASMVQTAFDELALDPNLVLFVSDQDAFLRKAKDLGMITCRVRPLSARRGNVSAHFEVETVLEVHDVVNEMNGISFNAVLNM